MIERYARPEMARIWEDENRFRLWLTIELLVLEALAKAGQVPREVPPRVKKQARVDPARIEELEKRTRHDVAAFVAQVGETIGADSRWLHWGLTSSDLLDTTFALQLKQAAEILEDDLARLMAVLKEKALKYKDLPMIGRTHGIHAEPITFGLKLALWYEETRRHLERLAQAKKMISAGKISGAVGTFAHLGLEVESYVMKKLGLPLALVSSQIIQRDRHAHYFTTLAIIGSSVEKFATEVRHLQRTEVAEVEEFFSEGQQGSSAMPHKRNPVVSERLCGLARLLRGYALAAMENVALWHERDISHSSVERIIAPDSTILLDFMLHELTQLLDNLVVYPGAMKANLGKTKGFIFSQMLMLALMRKGLPRQEAYQAVQKQVLSSFRRKRDFKKSILKDPFIARLLSPEEIEECFDVGYHIRYVDQTFARVFS